ncbi:MAG: protein kinase [Actinobacteria bacterium]|nr:protein kinase [Actinomycetota bacterium]
MTTGPCEQPGCGGTILTDGYCDTCGARAVVGAETATSDLARAGGNGRAPAIGRVISNTIRVRTRTTKVSKNVSGAVGGGLVEVPAIHGLSAEAAVIDDAVVPEHERFCSNPDCGRMVGRSRNGRPGRHTGHCPACGAWFSFGATLQKGDVLGGQYEILGPIGHGGRGWVYVGRDRNVADRAVVVKGILNAGDAAGANEAAAEMQYLAAVEHEHIVKIYNFVAHGDSAYIVMEYVEGTTLASLLNAQRAAGGSEETWLERSIAYVAAVLEALEYLHENQIAYNDMKPDNVMAVGRGCKLIDLGAAHRMSDPAGVVLATPGYYAPELAETGPTVATDLYTVGRTLLSLAEPDLDLRGAAAEAMPPLEAVPALAHQESLYRFLLRATDPNPSARFQSAHEMREQMLGVLREVVAARQGTPRPAVSDLFTPELEPGTTELRWQVLPAPRSVDKDPAVAFVAGLAGLDPKEVLDDLGDALRSGQLPNTIDTWTQVLRVCLEAGAFAFAEGKLNDLEVEAQGDWRLMWHRGLLLLATGRHVQAIAHFDQVYLAFPGEPAAKLAVAVAFEAAGDSRRAEYLYDMVSRVDPSFTSAVFGLARCLEDNGEVDDAVAALDRLSPTSRAWATGSIAAVRLLLDSLIDASSPDSTVGSALATERLQAAGAIVETEPLDPERRARLQREVFDTALILLERKRVVPHRKVRVLGRPLVSDGMRSGLEATYRELARFAPTPRQRIELIDLANFFRPTSIR